MVYVFLQLSSYYDKQILYHIASTLVIFTYLVVFRVFELPKLIQSVRIYFQVLSQFELNINV